MGGGVTYERPHRDDRRQPAPYRPGVINGGLMNRTSDTPAPVITVQVDSIDDALKKVEAGGGSRCNPGRRSQGWAPSATSRTAKAT